MLAAGYLAVVLAGGPVVAPPHVERASGSWRGRRDRLERAGLKLEGFVSADWSRVAAGGRTRGRSSVRALTELAATLDGRRALGWSGGTVHLGAQALAGRPGTALANDVQVFDNIDTPPFAGLAELWVQQVWLRGRLRLKAGRIEANSELASIERNPLRARRSFLHSSMGFSPTMLRFGSYPNQALGLIVEGQPSDWLRVTTGVFDGALEPSRLSTLDDATPEPAFHSVLGVTQLAASWSPRRHPAGYALIGAWGLAGAAAPRAATAGPYLIVVQTAWRERPSQGIELFGQYGAASPRASSVVHHAGGGLSWVGALPGRDRDVLALGASWVRLRQHSGPTNETAVEALYRIALDRFLWVTADLQLIVDAAGRNRNPLITTVRLGIDL